MNYYIILFRFLITMQLQIECVLIAFCSPLIVILMVFGSSFFFAEISTGSTVFCFCFWSLKHFLIGIHEPVGVLALVPWNPDFSDHLGSGNWFEIIFLSRKRKVASNSGEVRTIEDSKNQESTIFLHCD